MSMPDNCQCDESPTTEDPRAWGYDAGYEPNRKLHQWVESKGLDAVDMACYMSNAQRWLEQAAQGLIPHGGCHVTHLAGSPSTDESI